MLFHNLCPFGQYPATLLHLIWILDTLGIKDCFWYMCISHLEKNIPAQTPRHRCGAKDAEGSLLSFLEPL